MAVEHLKSVGVTNLDTLPVLANSPGEYGPGLIVSAEGWATPSASASTTSTYQLVRVPTNAKVKNVEFESAAQGAGAISLSVYYSDSTVDGTLPANQGLVVPSTGAAFFASQINCAAAVAITNETNQSGSYTIDKRVKPLWLALGLASDPGGFFDIVGVVDTTAITTGGGKIGLRVSYVM